MTASPPPSPGAKVGNICRTGAGKLGFWKQTAALFPTGEPTSLPGPLSAPLTATSPRMCPRAEEGTRKRLSPGTFNQCQWAQVLSWPGFYTANSAFLAKEGCVEDQTALGSLTADSS